MASASALRILADENIPEAQSAFGTLGTVRTLPGRAIGAADTAQADVLLVRSVTRVDAALVDDTPLQFVGSATIGTDHVDRDALADRGIAFAHAPASNADSVADYVTTALLHLAHRKNDSLSDKRVGIVGVGNIGSRLARRVPSLGARVLLNDPPRGRRGEAPPGDLAFTDLGTILTEADVITLHVPLTDAGPNATRHLIGADALAQMKPDAWLVNTSRGPVVDNAALREALSAPSPALGAAVLDVWENEPTPDLDLLRHTDLATPHIAGYAIDGKLRGTRMLYEALCDHLDVTPRWAPDAALAPEPPSTLALSPPDPRLPDAAYLARLATQAYPIRDDDARLRPIADRPSGERGAFFSRLRKTYPRRHELQRFHLPAASVPDRLRPAVRDGLTIQLT